jgi:hypothetical protein
VEKSWSDSPSKPLSRLPWPLGTIVAVQTARVGAYVTVRALVDADDAMYLDRVWTVDTGRPWSATVDEIAAAVGNRVYQRLMLGLSSQLELPFTIEGPG